MKNLNMQGPYGFDREIINDVVPDVQFGNYALGYEDKNGKFCVCYVGRSDHNLPRRIADHLGEHPKKFKFFTYRIASSEKEAFYEECRMYHLFGENENLYNKEHPDRPDGEELECPCCDIFD